MSWQGVVESIVSDLLFLLITVAVGWILLVVTRRTKLLDFFGVRKSRRIVIYLSNLGIVPGGAIGVDDRARHYQGTAVPFLESAVANRFRDLFNYLFPSLSDNPGWLSRLLISDVQVQLMHSPLSESELEHSSSFIAFGSPAYNTASKFVEEKLNSRARFRLGKMHLHSKVGTRVGIVTPGVDSSGEVASTDSPVSASSMVLDEPMNTEAGTAPLFAATYEQSEPVSADRKLDLDAETEDIPSAIVVDGVPPMIDENYGFVERIVDHEQDRMVFYVAGISELGTAGAAHYLSTEWAQLQRKYSDETPFLVVLSFEANNYKRSSIIFER